MAIRIVKGAKGACAALLTVAAVCFAAAPAAGQADAVSLGGLNPFFDLCFIRQVRRTPALPADVARDENMAPISLSHTRAVHLDRAATPATSTSGAEAMEVR